MQGTYVGSEGKEIGVSWQREAVVAVQIHQKRQQVEGKGTMVPDQHRQGKGDATNVSQQN